MNNLTNCTTSNSVKKIMESVPMKEILEKCWWLPIAYVSVRAFTDSITNSGYRAHFKFDKNEGICEMDLAPGNQSYIQ